MLGRRVVAALSATCALLVVVQAAAGDGPLATPTGRQEATIATTSTRPGAPTGSDFAVKWRNPADPDAQPPGIETILIKLAPGSVIDTSALKRCGASDAELIAIGAGACPAASRLGGGTIVSDSGPSSPVPRFVENEVTIFNGAQEQIALAETKAPPTVRAVGRTSIDGNTLRAEIPS